MCLPRYLLSLYGAIALLPVLALSSLKPSLANAVLAQTAPISSAQQTASDQLLQRGVEQYEHGQFSPALVTLQQALARYRATNSRVGESLTLTKIGAVYNDQGRYAQALELHQQAL